MLMMMIFRGMHSSTEAHEDKNRNFFTTDKFRLYSSVENRITSRSLRKIYKFPRSLKQSCPCMAGLTRGLGWAGLVGLGRLCQRYYIFLEIALNRPKISSVAWHTDSSA